MISCKKELAQAERERKNESSFRSSLPEDARLGNKQLREAEVLNQKLKEDPSFQLTEREKNLLQRAESYETHKAEFNKNNNTTNRDRSDNDEL